MPTERFFSLPEEKKQRIIRAALEELGRVPPAEASINKIIKAARIPRGSFYQYFEDKEDLFGLVTEEYRENMVRILNDTLNDTGGDVFEAIVSIFDYTVGYGMTPEHFPVCRNVFASPVMHLETTKEIITMVKGQPIFQALLPKVSLKGYRYNTNEDLDDLLEILIVVFRDSVQRIFTDVEDTQRLKKSFYNKIQMLENGIKQEVGKKEDVEVQC